jgi:hypothetical protein
MFDIFAVATNGIISITNLMKILSPILKLLYVFVWMGGQTDKLTHSMAPEPEGSSPHS